MDHLGEERDSSIFAAGALLVTEKSNNSMVLPARQHPHLVPHVLILGACTASDKILGGSPLPEQRIAVLFARGHVGLLDVAHGRVFAQAELLAILSRLREDQV